MNPIHYRGFTIQQDYRNPYSNVPEYMFFPTEQGEEHDADYDDGSWHYTGNCKWEDSIQEAKSEIDVLIAERTHFRVITPKTITKFWTLQDALDFMYRVGGEFKMLVNGEEQNFDAI
jgi:hypothetical protein